MRDGTLAARHLAERITIEQTQKRLRAETEPVDAKVYAQTAAGRRLLRGVPVVGTGGLDERRDPLLEVLDRERDAETRAAIDALTR